jgi:tetratricopeptide (TPR) repeat protein
VKHVQQLFGHNQLWVVLSSVGTLGGFVVALVVFIWPDPDEKPVIPQLPPSGSSASELDLPRGDTRFYLLLDEGEEFLRKGDIDRAFGSFDDAVKRIPSDNPSPMDQAFAYLLRGTADLMRGERVYALTDFKEAFERGTNETKGLAASSIGLTYIEMNDLFPAEEWLLRATNEFGNREPETYAGLGYLGYARRDYRDCVSNYSRALQSNLTTVEMAPRFLFGRALCAGELGDYRNALADVDEALDIGSSIDNALLDLRDDLLRKCGSSCR